MRRYTKRPQVLTSVRLPQQDSTLLYTAALQLGISQSEALRKAVRVFVRGVLLGAGPQPGVAEKLLLDGDTDD